METVVKLPDLSNDSDDALAVIEKAVRFLSSFILDLQ